MAEQITSWLFTKQESFPEEKRKKIDPRYRDPNYPEFVCQRKKPDAYRFKPEGKLARFFRGRLERKTIFITGIITLLILLLLFSICFFSLSQTTVRGLHVIKRSLNPILGL
ncbi:MAG: hypothetical protein JRI95_13560 [Deltaproteobacteria bacterium]|nr:hypothetical protein [Deltaproteobacteria bacterium]MBW2086767.1 hypothetical protein [Deltaproteobacteria bacterium]